MELARVGGEGLGWKLTADNKLPVDEIANDEAVTV
jgi:hypothetical protein